MMVKNRIVKILHFLGFGIMRSSNILKSNLQREELESYIRKIELFLKIQPNSKFNKALIASKLSKSQIGADIFVLDKLNFKENGYFIECGAGDGVHLSNTLLLEKEYGWTGILVEPNKRFHENIRRMRKAPLEEKLLGSRSGDVVQFKEFYIGELSGVTNVLKESREPVKDEYSVESINLNDLLIMHEAPREIDYFSLDVEGYEYEILKDFDFSKYIFRTLSVEHNFLDTRDLILSLLNQNGYYRIHENLSGFDDFYIHKSIS